MLVQFVPHMLTLAMSHQLFGPHHRTLGRGKWPSMSDDVEPLCEGCPFRCSGCPWDWMDEGVEPELLLARDRAARMELGLSEDDFDLVELYGEKAVLALENSVTPEEPTPSHELSV